MAECPECGATRVATDVERITALEKRVRELEKRAYGYDLATGNPLPARISMIWSSTHANL